MVFSPSKADHDVWTKDEVDNYSYICVYVYDVIYLEKKEKGFFKILEKLNYKLKGVGPPTYHLGGDFKRVNEPENMYHISVILIL